MKYLSVFYGCATQWHQARSALTRLTDTVVRDHWEVWLLPLKQQPLLQMLPAADSLHKFGYSITQSGAVSTSPPASLYCLTPHQRHLHVPPSPGGHIQASPAQARKCW